MLVYSCQPIVASVRFKVPKAVVRTPANQPSCPKSGPTDLTVQQRSAPEAFRAGHYGRFPFRKKTPEISVGTKVEFPIGKKLFHFGRKPWYVAVPDDSIQ